MAIAMTSFRWQFVSFLVYISCFAPEATGQESSRGTDPEVSFLTAALWESRASLRSAICTIEETEIVGERKSRASYFIAADFERNLVRFDRNGDGKVIYRVIRTPQHTLLDAGTGVIDKFGPTETVPLNDAQPIDLRALGYGALGQYRPRWSFERIKSHASTFRIEHTHQDETTGQWRLEALLDSKERSLEGGALVKRLRIVYLLDGSKSYCPESIEVTAQVRLESEADWRPTIQGDVTSTTWSEINGAWVPTKVSFRDDRVKKSVDVSCDWESVNEPIDPRYFEFDAFDAKDGSLVVDNRLGKPYIEQRIGTPPRTVTPKSAWREYSIAIGVVGLGLLAAVWFLIARRAA